MTSTDALGHRRWGTASSAHRNNGRSLASSSWSAGAAHHLAFLDLGGCPAGPVGAAGPVDLAALAAMLAVAGALMGAVGAADDGPGAGGRPAGTAFAVELDHDLGAQGGVLLVAAYPGGQLLVGAFPGREQAAVEGHKRRVQHGRGRGGDGAWGEAEAVALPGGPQRPIRDPKFLAGLVDADLGGALPGLLGGVAVLVEAGALGPALERLGLGEAVLGEGAPQGLFAHAQLAGGPVDAVLVRQRQRRFGRGPVVQEPGAFGHRGAAAQRYAVAGGGAGEDPCVVVAGLGTVHRRLQAGAADRAAGAYLLGRRGLGNLAGFGEEQLGVDLGAGGVQAPVPLPVGPLDRWGWAGELLVGGGQPLGQGRLLVAGAELPGDMAH